MKRLIKSIVLVAVAAMALPSCQKNEIPAPEKQDVHFTINAGVQTKTHIEETIEGDQTIYKPKWDGNEELGLLLAAPNGDTKAADVVKLNNTESGDEALFQGTVTVDATEGTFYAFYPASAFNRGYSEGDARLDLKNVQKPTATSFDPTCDILVAKPYEYEVVDGKVVANGLQFARVMSVLRIDLNSEFADVQNEFVESVSFTAGDVKITGYARILLDNPEFNGNWASSGDQWCTVTANYDSDLVSINGTSNSVYLVIAPVTIPANKDLTFAIKTKNYNISKTIKSPEMKFTAGKVSKINLTIAADNCNKIDTSIDYSGLYAILTKRSSGDYYYMTNDLGTASTKRLTAVSAGADLPVEGVVLGPSKLWEVSKSGDLYTVKSLGSEQYITWTSGNSANLGSTGINFTIENNEDGTYKFSYAASDATRYLSLNGTSGNDYFALYKSGQRMDLHLIPAVEGEEPAVLEVVAPSQISADGGSGSFTYTLINPKDGVQLEAETESEWITDITISDGTVSYTVAPNEIEEVREGLITLTYGELTKDITISQAAWEEPNTGGDDESIVAPSGTVLWAETWADAGANSTTFTQNSAISTYNYAGRTGFEANANSVTYVSDASNNVRITKSSGGNCTSGHLWFNKSVAGELKTSSIKLYGATSLTFSHSQGTSGSSCQTSYSVDGGLNWTSLGTQSGAIAKKTYTFTVASGTESIMIKLTHASSNSKNTRVDNLELKVQ